MSTFPQSDFDRRLNAFRARVDLRACLPSGNPPYWLSEICRRSREDFGVLALLGPTGVGIARDDATTTRYNPDPPTLGLVGLASLAREHGQALAVACPPVGRHLPLLLVASTTLAQTVQRQRNTQSADGRGILVVSSDLDVRSRYCDLHVGSLPLEQAHPGSRLRPNGDRVPLTAGHDLTNAPGVCFYLPRGALPSQIDFRPALIVVDLRYARTNPSRIDELIAWVSLVRKSAGVIVLHSCGDTDTADKLLRAQYGAFALDHRAITTWCAAVQCGSVALDVGGLELRIEGAASFLQRQHRVLEVANAEQVEQLFANIGEILDANSRVENVDLNRARWLLATIRQLPVPISWYEQTAYTAGRQTLRNLIGRIGVMSRHERMGAVLQSLRMQFELLYREMERNNPRSIDLQQRLSGLVASQGKTLLLVRDRTTQRALRTWIDLESFRGAEWTQRLDIIACPEYAAAACTRYSRAIVCGVLPRRHRWIAGAALGNETYFITYPHEIDVVEQQLRTFYDPHVLGLASQQRSQTVARIAGVPLPTNLGGKDSTPPTLKLQKPPRRKAQPTAKTVSRTNSLSDLAALLAAAQQREAEAAASAQSKIEASWRANDGEAETAEDVPASTIEAGSEVRAYRFHVRSSSRGEGYIWLPEHLAVECVSPKRPNDLVFLPPNELEPGDVVLRVEEGGRADLFDKIVELAEGQPQLAYLGRFRREWRDALDRVAVQHREHEYVDYPAILKKLQQHGATIQSTLTVRNWIESYVIGPEEVSSIKAVGYAAGLESVARSAKDFDLAFRRIRGIHQGIGRRLNTAIRQQFKSFAVNQPEVAEEIASVLDSRLGLPLEELLETVEYLQVLNLSDEPAEISAAMLQYFEKA